MSRIRVMLIVCTLLLALTPAGGRASDTGGGCGGTWYTTAPKSCHFNFRGLPIKVRASARVASGTADLHIWVDVQGFPQIVLYECRASAPLFAQCEDELGVGQTLDERYATFLLACHIEGHASSTYENSYYCQSALGF